MALKNYLCQIQGMKQSYKDRKFNLDYKKGENI